MIFHKPKAVESDHADMSLVFLSLLLVLITFFIVLTRFVETDPQKVDRFKRNYSHSLFFVEPGKGKKQIEQQAEIFVETDPLQTLINRMKAIGLTEPLMNQFLNMNEIKVLNVISGESGLVLRLPEPIRLFGDTLALSDEGRKILERLKVLFVELPYIIEIKGVGIQREGALTFKTLELGVTASQCVYRQLLLMGVLPDKIKISGTVDAQVSNEGSYIELAFRENV